MVEELNMNNVSKNLPEKRFTAGAITATIWKNEVKDAEYKTVTLQRAYKDKEDNWKHTSNLRANDVPRAILVLKKSYEYIVMKKEVLKE